MSIMPASQDQVIVTAIIISLVSLAGCKFRQRRMLATLTV
jgi:hypothetical protein